MADKCGKCDDSVKSTNCIKCNSCDGVFHPQCCKLSKTRSGTQTTWRCDSCKTDASSADSEPTSGAVIGTLLAIRTEIAENMKESRERFTGIEFCINEVKDAVSDIQQKLKRLEDDNENIKKQCSDNAEALKKTSNNVAKQQIDILELQQYMRRGNLEIHGIPLTTNENIYEIMKNLAHTLEVNYDRKDFSVVHRLPARRSGLPVIIAAFISRSVRNLWYAASRKKQISTTDISPRLSPGRIYINVHLSSHNKQLLGRAKRMVKEKNLAAAWTTPDGKVFVKKMEGENSIRIFLMEDLDRLLE